IRKRFAIRRFIELIFCLGLQLFLIEQYIFPLVQNSLQHFNNLNFLGIAERVLKLSIPLTIFWLLMFYSIFHAYLNLMAELLRFGDRLFYRDWWNCKDLVSNETTYYSNPSYYFLIVYFL